MKETMIRVRRVEKSFSTGSVETRVLRGISLDVDRGEFCAIAGPSGCGKTTLLGLLGGLDLPTSGSIEVDGVDIAKLDRAGSMRYRRDKVGFVFQFYNLLPSLSALENVEVGLDLMPLSSRQRHDRAMDYLERVGLAKEARKFPAQLSGGQQQRVAVARALAREPAVLLADEPTGNLDQETGAQVFAVMQSLQRDLGVTCVMVTHDGELAAQTDRVIRVTDGQVETPTRPSLRVVGGEE